MQSAVRTKQSVQPRILLLTDSSVLAGTERHMLDLAKGLSSLKVDVMVGCPAGAMLQRQAQALGISTITAPARFFTARMLMTISDSISSGQINLVHAHNGVAHLIAVGAISLAQAGKCVATHHFLSPARTHRRGLSSWFSHNLHRWACRHTDHFIAISNAVAEACANLNSGTRMSIIHNGIFPLRPLLSAEQVRARFSIPAGSPLIVTAARLDPEKSLDTLIEAMNLLKADIPEAICLIAGEGKENQNLQRLIDNRRLSQSVRLIGFQSDVNSIINAADIFVLPSLCEPFGLVILEAMSAGKPVIAAAAGGPLELIEHNVNGWFFPPRDVRALAYALDLLVADRALAASLGKAGQQLASRKFTAMQTAEQTLLVYRSVLAVR